MHNKTVFIYTKRLASCCGEYVRNPGYTRVHNSLIICHTAWRKLCDSFLNFSIYIVVHSREGDPLVSFKAIVSPYHSEGPNRKDSSSFYPLCRLICGVVQGEFDTLDPILLLYRKEIESILQCFSLSLSLFFGKQTSGNILNQYYI